MNDTAVSDATTTLAAIAALPSHFTLQPSRNGFSGKLADGGRLDMILSPRGPVMTLRGQYGEVQQNLVLNVMGDAHSPAYWSPTGQIDPWHRGEDWGDITTLNLSSLIERLRALLQKVTFVNGDGAISLRGKANTAMRYIRSMSGFPHPWLVSCASPFEVFAEDDPSGECTFEMDTLPPGLCEIGECAVVSVDQDGNQTIVTVRPAMLEFKTMVSGTRTDQARARKALSNIGFTGDEIAALDAASATARGYLPARY
ncbi:hypothetical protein [Sphingomonas faeni]|uniref:hypothetical protein n=1 Tax=Sphingomonas faeni TaxID=185950 RepID=UPI0027893A1A|nr:hypothetical protein [Sphingomonas faeni]MDQ0836218.1 hypothetical protein [Sphingomonas faeni]